jgi:hypothetical protein
MKYQIEKILDRRSWRHILFWVCWVAGFTFIKSFGKDYEVYFAWFSYYMITLPIFVSHTYLIAYVLVPHFFNRRGMPLFVFFFLVLFFGFSVLELLVSHEFIFKWYSTGTVIPESYLTFGNVIISGLGNLYIVLVFFAARTIRNWSLARNREKELLGEDLKQQMEESMTRVQPLMLLFAIDHIETMVEESSPESSRAIALTSELLNEVMIYHEEGKRWISREIEMVKKMIQLVELFKGKRPEVEFFISGDPGNIDLPPMILFSFVDLFFRRFDHLDTYPELDIEASGLSNMISIQVLKNSGSWEESNLEECFDAMRRLERIFSRQASISYVKHGYGCSVTIRKPPLLEVNAIDSGEQGVSLTERAAG